MKKDIHPQYREVVFLDLSSDHTFVTRSTIQTNETIELEGKKYPLVKVEISSDSHPFYTGKKSTIAKAGRVERFNQKYKKG